MICLGDETWAALYPNQFDVVKVFDSFNTNDLDTVDNGILEHLIPLLEADESNRTAATWSLFVAHFLGVDHVGHSFHARHILMREKIALMDALIEEVIKRLPGDALLLVFGDHGMSVDGEHGGASTDETDSGLFIYSPRPLFDVKCPSRALHAKEELSQDHCSTPSWSEESQSLEWRSVLASRTAPRIVNQVDLVPSVSLLLGLPIPFSSIGSIIPELFYSSSGVGHDDDLTRKRHLMDSFFPNAVQVTSDPTPTGRIRPFYSCFGGLLERFGNIS